MISSNNSWNMLSISYQKPLRMCNHLQNPVSEWKVSNILTLLQRANQRPKSIILLLPTSFSRPGSAKISESPQKSSDFPHQGLQAERDKGYHEHTEAKDRTQNHHCTWDPTATLNTHLMLLQGLYVSQQNKPVVMFLLIWQADPQHSDRNICQLHETCSSKPSWRLMNRKV